MVLLSALPCSDELEEFNFTQNASLDIAHGIAEGQMETCSPICACTCCGTSMVEIEAVNLTVKAPLNLSDQHNSTYNFHLQQRNRNIWHPPKIV